MWPLANRYLVTMPCRKRCFLWWLTEPTWARPIIFISNLSLKGTVFNNEDLADYLTLARMVQDPEDPNHYTRLINGEEGFTPPGLLFGLTYAWYLDNRFASHIEYKMAVMKVDHTDLIPEQVKMRSRRESLIVFFREVVFGH